MNIERIDHIHIKVDDRNSVTKAFEDVLGQKIPIVADFTADYGMKVSFSPFPYGLEIMEVTDKTKEMASLYAASPEGVFAISYKVPDIDEAIAEMESMGNKLLLRYDFGQIKEALFDTKKTTGVFLELIEYPTSDILAADSGHAGKDGKSEVTRKDI
jgi:catechol 2,3-dioxygenase-like lactoylglutathione lyase family enzyme